MDNEYWIDKINCLSVMVASMLLGYYSRGF